MLTPQENLDSVNQFTKEAQVAVNSTSFLEKLGGLTIFAGVVDFLAIQAARATEQAIMKDDLLNKRPSQLTDPGAPHEDKWFYDHKISTRRIIKQIEAYASRLDAVKHPELIKHIRDMVEHGDEFLNNRITAIHYVGNPRISREKMEEAVNDAVTAYIEFDKSFTLFREGIHPFTFSIEERKKFYGDDETKGIIIMGKNNV